MKRKIDITKAADVLLLMNERNGYVPGKKRRGAYFKSAKFNEKERIWRLKIVGEHWIDERNLDSFAEQYNIKNGFNETK